MISTARPFMEIYPHLLISPSVVSFKFVFRGT